MIEKNNSTDGSDALDGVKYDQEKPRWDLLPFKPINEVVKVLTFGATKYADDNWQKVPNAKNRYFAAAQRHIWAWVDGEHKDSESGLHHLAHAVCCLLFAMWFDMRPAVNLGIGYKALKQWDSSKESI